MICVYYLNKIQYNYRVPTVRAAVLLGEVWVPQAGMSLLRYVMCEVFVK